MLHAFITPTFFFVSRPCPFSPTISPHHPSRCKTATKALLPPDHVEYSREEGLDDADSASAMTVWNSVIHASLKRKLQGLVTENPFASGVSALMHAAPGYAAPQQEERDTQQQQRSDVMHHDAAGKQPEDIVASLLETFRQDALAGAKCFIQLATERNHVKRSSPQALVLFVGDNDSYRVLLHVSKFSCNPPRWEQSGERCIVTANVWGAAVESAVFDFQMERAPGGGWLVDEVFRL